MTLDLVILEKRLFPYRRLFSRYARAHWFNPIKATVFNPYLNVPYLVNEQSRYEMERFFPNGDYGYDEGVRVESVRSVNGARATTLLNEAAPDILLVYGTGIVRPHVYNLPLITSINCHGGFLPYYRGLDTNLWAVLKGEYDRMALSWHAMDESFDTGPVFMMERVEPRPDMSITTLRYYTALLATDMCVRLLKGIANGGMEARDQPADRGQYYSYVPWVLKPLANWKLRRYARRSTGDQRE